MDVITAAANVAEDFPGGARALAGAIDRNATTFSHELSETGAAKLGLRTAVKMTIRSKDLRILNAFAAECGCMVLPLPEAMAVEGDDSMQLVSKLMAELNDTVQAYVGALVDGKVSANEVNEIKRQGGELQVALQQLIAHAVSQHEASQPAHIRSVA
jgi:hypothetical protein